MDRRGRPSSLIFLLRLVDGTAVALLAGGVLHVFELFPGALQLTLHAPDFLLFLSLPLVPLNTTGGAVTRGEPDGLFQLVDVALQRVDKALLGLNAGLPRLSREFALGSRGSGVGVGAVFRGRRRRSGVARVFGKRFVSDDLRFPRG